MGYFIYNLEFLKKAQAFKYFHSQNWNQGSKIFLQCSVVKHFMVGYTILCKFESSWENKNAMKLRNKTTILICSSSGSAAVNIYYPPSSYSSRGWMCRWIGPLTLRGYCCCCRSRINWLLASESPRYSGRSEMTLSST